jgi:hypothetical protein
VALVTLPNLYCSPSDIFDFLGSENVQSRLDDHHLATGQTVQVVTSALQGDSVLSIAALTLPLLPGSTLEFDGGGMAANVEVVLAAVALVGATTLSVLPLPAAVNQYAQAQDNGVNVATAARLIKGCSYGTAAVKRYCCSRYNDSNLATCWSANYWATVEGSLWVATRRGQPPPKSIRMAHEEVMDELKAVRYGSLNLEDIGTRNSGWPFITSVSVDISYDYRKIRVEPQLSEGTPTFYGQQIDWNAAFCLEW